MSYVDIIQNVIVVLTKLGHFQSKTVDFIATVSTVPNTWYLHGAWKMAFRNWLNSNRERMDDGTLRTVSKIAKYVDFRLAMARGACTDDSDKWNLIEIGNDVSSQAVLADGTTHVGIDEFKLSQYTSSDTGVDADVGETDPQTDKFTAHVLGDHFGSPGVYGTVGIIKAFQETLLKSNTVGDRDGDGDSSDDLEIEHGVWANLMEVAQTTPEVIEHLIDDFNQPPFDGDDFVGTGNSLGTLVRHATLDPGGSGDNQPGGEVFMPGFECPLGMLSIDIDGTEGSDHYIEIELIPGTYQGVAAESMGTPKFTNRKLWSVS